MGDAVVNLLNEFREKPTTLPKNYKREIEKPEREEYTALYKIKNGLRNFVFLGYALGTFTVVAVGLKIYNSVRRAYYRYKLSLLSPEEQNQLVEYAMFLEEPEEPKRIECKEPTKTK